MANLYNKAGLVNIPVGYSDGFLYNIKPVDDTLAFRFNRDSSATRVNKQGLIEQVSYFGPELVTNGDFATDSDWQKTNAVIEDGVGKLQESVGTYTRLRQNTGFTGQAKVTYTISFNNTSNTTIQLRGFGGQVFQNSPATVGTHTVYINYISEAVTFQSGDLAAGEEIHLDNVSVVEVLGDKPRIDYTDSLTSPSFLLEPQSTNLALNSNDLTNNTWAKLNATTSTSTVVNPEGTSGASLYTCNNYTGSNQYFRINPNITYDNDVSYSYSVFVKYNTFQFCKLSYMNFNINEHFAAVFDIINGTVTATATNGTPQNTNSKIENFGNGWFRISISAAISSSSGNAMNFEFNKAPSGTPTFTGYGRTDQTTTTDDKVYVYGGQLEQLTYPTSYIPTAGSTVTRAQETCNGAGNASTFNSTEGVLYAEIAALANDLTARVICISDGTNSHRVLISFSTLTNQIQGFHYNGITSSVSLLHTVSDITVFHKIAFKYKLNDFSLWVDGVQVATSSSGGVNIANTFNTLEFQNASGTSDFYGKGKGVYVFNKALTDDELQQLTGPDYNSFAALAAAYNYTVI